MGHKCAKSWGRGGHKFLKWKADMEREPKNERNKKNEKLDDNKWAATSSIRFIIILNERVRSPIIPTIYSDWWGCDLSIIIWVKEMEVKRGGRWELERWKEEEVGGTQRGIDELFFFVWFHGRAAEAATDPWRSVVCAMRRILLRGTLWKEREEKKDKERRQAGGRKEGKQEEGRHWPPYCDRRQVCVKKEGGISTDDQKNPQMHTQKRQPLESLLLVCIFITLCISNPCFSVVAMLMARETG